MATSGIAVLLVDDQPDITETFKFHLERFEGFIVYTAADGAAGLEAFYASTPRPACVVLDVKMPEIDGNQLARVFRGDPETVDIPIIILTAYVQTHDRQVGEMSGADFYIAKPISPSSLAAKIREALAITTEQRTHRMRRIADDDAS